MNKDAILAWIKANPLIVACMAIVLLCLVSFYYPSKVWADAFRSDLAAREGLISQINGLKRSTVEIPPARPDDPPTQLTTVVNAETVNRLRDVYQKMESEYTGIFQRTTEHNKQGHEPMLSGLFPSPLDPQSRPYEARAAYTNAIAKLNQVMNAGTPPTREQIDQVMAMEEENYRRSLLGVTVLTQEQTDELLRRQATAVSNLYKNHAAKMHVYAPPVALHTQEWSPGAFQVGDWAKPSAGLRPALGDIWEGQMQLWIQQDIARAIAIANKVGAPETSVQTAPVKRVIAMFVKPGYIGITPGTGATTASTGGPVQQYDEEGNPVTAAATTEAGATDINQKLAPDFVTSPTGRKSNGIYDVRHAVLTAYVDSRKLPDLLNAISQVNFMTVLNVAFSDVDEYADLLQGYYYGRGADVVKVDLTIETIWMRSWTAGHESREAAAAMNPPIPFDPGLMPDEVRVALKLPPRSNAPTAPAPVTPQPQPE